MRFVISEGLRRTVCGLVAVLCGLCVTDPVAKAGPLPVLEKEMREAWVAVGRVNGQGYRRLQGCSGTLIAPDLVVTAAHCVIGTAGIARERHYVAGWYRGRFTAHRISDRIDVHPLYELVPEHRRGIYDIAVLYLSDPIPEGLVKPVPLLPEHAAQHDEALLLGYQNSIPHALAGKKDCDRKPVETDDWLLYGCEVVGGTSGGAVIVDSSDGPALAAVIVARSGPNGLALAVPVNSWLRDAWRAAKERARR